jgi:hypothetical protein
LGSFTPAGGNSWDIVTATTSLTSSAALDAGDVSDYSLSVVGGNTLRLTRLGVILYGDYDGDGFITSADYVEYRNQKAAGATSILNEDPTQSPGALNKLDYLVWKNAYAATHGSGSGSGNVPEPTSLVLVLMAVLGLCGFARQR